MPSGQKSRPYFSCFSDLFLRIFEAAIIKPLPRITIIIGSATALFLLFPILILGK